MPPFVTPLLPIDTGSLCPFPLCLSQQQQLFEKPWKSTKQLRK